ncbi:MAG: hypothetical protein WC506_03800 [Candidatus Micrarchaeia archaeon]
MKKSKAKPKKQPKARKPAPKAAPKKAAKKAAAPRKQKMTYRDIPTRARDEIESLKMSMQPHFTTVEHEVELPRATQVMDKVYLQRISFEISGIRQAIERMNKQLSRLESELGGAKD